MSREGERDMLGSGSFDFEREVSFEVLSSYLKELRSQSRDRMEQSVATAHEVITRSLDDFIYYLQSNRFEDAKTSATELLKALGSEERFKEIKQLIWPEVLKTYKQTTREDLGVDEVREVPPGRRLKGSSLWKRIGIPGRLGLTALGLVAGLKFADLDTKEVPQFPPEIGREAKENTNPMTKDELISFLSSQTVFNLDAVRNMVVRSVENHPLTWGVNPENFPITNRRDYLRQDGLNIFGDVWRIILKVSGIDFGNMDNEKRNNVRFVTFDPKELPSVWAKMYKAQPLTPEIREILDGIYEPIVPPNFEPFKVEKDYYAKFSNLQPRDKSVLLGNELLNNFGDKSVKEIGETEILKRDELIAKISQMTEFNKDKIATMIADSILEDPESWGIYKTLDSKKAEEKLYFVNNAGMETAKKIFTAASVISGKRSGNLDSITFDVESLNNEEAGHYSSQLSKSERIELLKKWLGENDKYLDLSTEKQSALIISEADLPPQLLGVLQAALDNKGRGFVERYRVLDQGVNLDGSVTARVVMNIKDDYRRIEDDVFSEVLREIPGELFAFGFISLDNKNQSSGGGQWQLSVNRVDVGQANKLPVFELKATPKSNKSKTSSKAAAAK